MNDEGRQLSRIAWKIAGEEIVSHFPEGFGASKPLIPEVKQFWTQKGNAPEPGRGNQPLLLGHMEEARQRLHFLHNTDEAEGDRAVKQHGHQEAQYQSGDPFVAGAFDQVSSNRIVQWPEGQRQDDGPGNGQEKTMNGPHTEGNQQGSGDPAGAFLVLLSHRWGLISIFLRGPLTNTASKTLLLGYA